MSALDDDDGTSRDARTCGNVLHGDIALPREPFGSDNGNGLSLCFPSSPPLLSFPPSLPGACDSHSPLCVWVGPAENSTSVDPLDARDGAFAALFGSSGTRVELDRREPEGA